MVRKLKIYVDTSVFGGTQDKEFEKFSRRFFDRVLQNQYIVLLSDETLRELVKAPDNVRKVWQTLPAENIIDVAIDDEMEKLAQAYINAEVLGKASISDAIHVAAASVVGADLILSWNFRHIVNFDRIRGFNSINVQQGYRVMTILSPMEVCGDEDKN